jgi:molybdopterin-containing oxidoreductase family iron-sulfur binding subunit
MSHDLETWSDARAYDGTATILQPLILPMYETRSPLELLERVLTDQPHDDRQIVQEYWQSTVPADSFEQFWEESLHDGVVAGTASQSVPVTLGTIDFTTASPVTEGLEIVIRPDPTIWDGAFNNNGWLQELPKPFTKLTWDNAALISPATAQRLKVSNEDLVTLHYGDASVQAAIWILPGQADDSVTLTLGYGRTKSGHIGSGTGFNAYPLVVLPTWFGTGLELAQIGKHYPLATTQDHFTLDGRDLIHTGTLEEFQQAPDLGYENSNEQPSLYPAYPPGE